ncbi:MAG: hypothetical protein E6J41_26985 [Chloroflexi bacterium]|nr:MAG: hypothetical protein E6J41_26985 [Chloroflexota bacterium]
MATGAPQATSRTRWLRLLVLAVCGVAAGLLLDVLTGWVSAVGPSSPDGQYSLRGNGALIVPLGGALVLVTAAWTALVTRWLGHPRPLAPGVAAGLLDLGVLLLALAFALPVLAPIAAAVRLRPRGAAGTDGGWTAAAMVLFPVSLLAGSGLGVPLSQLAA